ncbi:MAG: hypothetical protein HFE04_00440 [Bacilli bacterium]|nr:hypothetical protein [Bacilli bacterium]
MKKKILIISIITMVALSSLLFIKKEDKETPRKREISIDTKELISYTIDGAPTTKRPNKEDGYIANKIECENDSDIMWDNDNWEVEITDSKKLDRCVVDFPKEESTLGYRVTITTNNIASLDSLSKATTNGGTVVIYSLETIKNVSGCNGTIEGDTLIISNVTNNVTCNITLELKTLANKIKIEYPPLLESPELNDGGIPSLYAGTDNQGTTYYFSGNGASMKNWVSFAGKKWIIIRINGNGSVRLLYAGDGNDATDIGTSPFNNSHDHPAYVGWKYTVGGSLEADRGNTTKSDAYTKVEAWYNSLSTNDKNYIDTKAIYCNDRNIASGFSYSTTATFYYTAHEKTYPDKKLTFNCSNTNDKFYNFGLMTADEVEFAIAAYGTSEKKSYYYLAQDGTSSITGSSYWWTMSPYLYRGNGNAFVSLVREGSLTYEWNSHGDHVIRPVISLKSNVVVKNGDGSGTSPYEISL